MAIAKREGVYCRELRDVVEGNGRVGGKAHVRIIIVGRSVAADRLKNKGAQALSQGELNGNDGLAIRLEVAGAIGVNGLLNRCLIGGLLPRVSFPGAIGSIGNRIGENRLARR